MATGTIKADRTTMIGIQGNWASLGRADGAVSISIPIPGVKNSSLSLSKTSGISASIYGSKLATACTLTFDSNASGVQEDGHLFLKFTPSVTVSTYTDAAKIFMLSIDEPITVTLV